MKENMKKTKSRMSKNCQNTKHRTIKISTILRLCPISELLIWFTYPHIKRKKHIWECSFTSIRIDDKSYIDPYDLEDLKENKFLENIKCIKKASDLLGRFIESTAEADYSELTNVVLTHKANIKLRNMVLKLIPLYMIYSKNTLPEYGYIRAKSFIRMFNKEYDLNMDTEEIDEIMSRDYSNIEKPKMKIIQNIRK